MDNSTVYSGNVPPNARAGLDQTAYTSSPVNLDGSASFDPDAGPSALTYLWTFASRPPMSSAAIVDATQPKASFTPDVSGSYELNLRVSDGKDSNDDQVTITASLPNVAPNAVAGPDQNVAFSKEVTLNGTASNDPDSGPNALAHAWRFVYLPAGSALSNASLADADKATARFTPDKAGSYVVQLAVNDGDASDFDQVLIKVTTPLTIKSVTASPNTLWPPNHKMVPVKVTVSATSPGNPTPVCQIRSVASNEPVNGTGDGDTAPDWQITGALTVNLRAERAGNGTGRVYTITVQCMDKAGNRATKDATVTVPHDQGK